MQKNVLKFFLKIALKHMSIKKFKKSVLKIIVLKI